MAKNKYQVFVSSTYIDLKEERQAAVEAILTSRHIPAGMELFKAGNKTQLETIKKWIDESDLYMLILGGRYGSIEPETGKSYTQIEYEYALEKEIPVFAVVLNDSFLYKKASETKDNIFEKDNKEKYDLFKEFVMSKIIKRVDDCKDIQIAVKDSIVELEEDYPLSGWVKASEVQDNTKVIKENNELLKENNKLKEEIKKIKEAHKIGKFKYEDLKRILKNIEITVEGEIFNTDKDLETNCLNLMYVLRESFIKGITNEYGMTSFNKFVYFDLAPKLITYELVEYKKIAGVQYRRCEFTKLGLEFIANFQVEKQDKKNNKKKTIRKKVLK